MACNNLNILDLFIRFISSALILLVTPVLLLTPVLFVNKVCWLWGFYLAILRTFSGLILLYSQSFKDNIIAVPNPKVTAVVMCIPELIGGKPRSYLRLW